MCSSLVLHPLKLPGPDECGCLHDSKTISNSLVCRFLPGPGLESPGGNATAALKAVGTYWDSDTALKCWEGADMKGLLALGSVWAGAFCLGFPLLMGAILLRNRYRLSDERVSPRASSSL